MDGTFWNGTLEEDNVTISKNNIKIIKELNNRGIINSISSKNNFDLVKNKLTEINLWDYFVFPKISYSPKFLMIKDIITNTCLRQENILFIDDEPINLEEAKYHFPNINIETPDFIKNMLKSTFLLGSKNKDFNRLSLYKNLEKRQDDKLNYDSNNEFLISSNIQVEIIKNCPQHINRIFQLINRTNQLNFTKNRIGNIKNLSLLLSNSEYGVIRVSDKYGDYGISGFYSMKNGELDHFLFSCRLLNLGVEQWVYNKLNFPPITIVGEVASILNKAEIPAWIKEAKNLNLNTFENKSVGKIKNKKKLSIIIRGSCDLGQVAHYLSSFHHHIETEFNYNSIYGYPIHRLSSEILYANIDKENYSEETKKHLVKSVNFFDNKTYKTSVFSGKYDLIIISVLMDYTQGIYTMNKNEKIHIPFGDYNLPITDKNNHQKFMNINNEIFTDKFLKFFSEEFTFQGPISNENFYKNLKAIRKEIGEHTPIIFINGSEVESPNKLEIGRDIHHKNMNNTLDSFICNSKNCFLLDVRNIVTDNSQLKDNIRHYDRESYMKISQNLNILINNLFNF